MQTVAVVLDRPGHIALTDLTLTAPTDEDVVVDVAWSGISTGTERLLWTGRMPPFPGLGYPLVPGYEAVGVVVEAGEHCGRKVGESVFVPGASCYGPVRGLFGGASRRLVAKGRRAVPVAASVGQDGVLLALAATAHHALLAGTAAESQPELIVGHGVLGRLLARLCLALGHRAVTVWETDPARRAGAVGYSVVAPDDDPRRDYQCMIDASGDARILEQLVSRSARGGEIVLAGFYDGRIGFDFVPAFLRESRIRVAAEWTPDDLIAVAALVDGGRLDLSGLVTHQRSASAAADAYAVAFDDAACLKMVLDWRAIA